MIYSFLKKKKKKLVSCRGAPQENDAKFRFAIHPQRCIMQFHDNCNIAKCRLLPHWRQSNSNSDNWQDSRLSITPMFHSD